MELRSPKLRVLPSSNGVSAILDEDKLWEIDSPSLERSLGLAYLFSIVDKMDFENIICKLIGLEEVPKTDHWISKIKSSITKYNPFKNRRAIYSDRIIKMILNKIKIQLHGEINIDEQELLKVHLQLESASKLFDCAVLLYRGEPSTNCEFISMHKNDNLSIGDSLKIVIFQSAVLPPTDESSPSSRFGFGLSMAYCQPLRHSSIVNCLKTAKIPDDKILQVEQATFSDTSLLKCIFDAGCEDIIPSIYRSSYLVLRISEAGFDIDPCTLDNNGLSSFYYSMGLPKSDSLNMIYNFATNNFHLTDSSVRKPDKNILLALEKVESVIKKDCVVSDNFSLLNVRKCAASKRCQEILFFNKYQREICQLVYNLKKEKNSMERNKQVMVSILDTYRKYLYFDSIFSDDNLQLFKNFVKYSEYHENLDNFNCLLFFDNFSAMIPLISNNHLKNVSDAISSLFLSVLSNEFIPKHKHEIDCTDCKLSLEDVCDQNENIQRIIPFNYRICFSKKAQFLANFSTDEQQQDPVPLLDILRKSLVNFPEIVDEFIVTRLTSYLEAASMQLHDSPIKRMLTMERALQVVGEIFGNKTVCKSVVRVLLQSCVPAEVVNKLISLRDNAFSHYRRNAVHGRLKMEKDNIIAGNIQKELSDLDENFRPVYISQIYRVKEFLIKEGKKMLQNTFEDIQAKMDAQLQEFINKRKPLCGEHEVNFEYILFNVFKELFNNLNDGNMKDIQTDLEATYFLLNFVAGHSSPKYSSELKLSSTADELRQIITSFEEDNNISDVAVNKIKKIIRFHFKILEETFFNDQEETITNTDFPFIYSLNDKIKNAKRFNAKAKKNIRREVIKYVNNSTMLMQTLKNCLRESTSIDDLNNKLEYIILPEQKRFDVINDIGENTEIGIKKALKTLSQVKETEYLKELFTFDENGDIPESFRGKEELMNMLLKIELPKMLRKRVVRILNTKLWFLINRIDRLKAILISEDDNLRGLWRSRKWKLDSTFYKHMKYIMIQRYLHEKDLLASMEMLLFDCMNILGKRKDLKDLWEKTNDLFKGANVIKVLAHGNTVIQNVGSILSPEDLPSEFIEKILELIKDVDSMRALSELWSKTKLCKKTHFLLAAKSEVTDEHSELRKRIKTSSRWEEYACLLPLKDY